MAPVDSAHPTLDHGADHSDAASMRLNIHFTHPLVENQDERPLLSSDTTDNEFSHGGNLVFDPVPEDFLSQFTFDEDQRLLVMP
jgi:hypothetical protein